MVLPANFSQKIELSIGAAAGIAREKKLLQGQL